MAKEIKYKTTVDTSDLEELNKQTENLKKLRDKANDPKEIERYNKQIAQSEREMRGLNDGVKTSTKATKGMTGATRAFGTALKATGIGLVVALLVKLGDALMSNQKIADGFSVVMGTVKEVFSQITKAAEPLVDAFSAIIEMRWSDATDAFSEFGTRISELGSNLGQVTKDAYSNAKAITNLRNEIELLEAQTDGQVQVLERQAEQLRQQRDNTNLTLNERLKASKQLGDVLEEQAEIESRLAQKRVDLARMELQQEGENIENKKAVIEAENQFLEIQNRIETQRTERLNAERAVTDEIRDQQEAIEFKNEKEAQSEIIKMQRISSKDIEITTQRENIKQELAKQTASVKQAASKAEAEADRLAQERIMKNRQAAANASINVAKSVLSATSSFMEEGSKMAKGVAIAQTTIETFKSATAAYSSVVGTPIVGPVLAPIAAGAAIAAGLAVVHVGLSQDPKKGSGTPSAGGSGSGRMPQVQSLTPDERMNFGNNVDQNRANARRDRLNGNEGPARAYVLEGDVTSSQEAQSRLERESTL